MKVKNRITIRKCLRIGVAVGYVYSCLMGMTIMHLIKSYPVESKAPNAVVFEKVQQVQKAEVIEPAKLIEAPKVVSVEPEVQLTDAEINLIALVTMAEAEGESEQGKRLVIDTILNRVDHKSFPDTVNDVVYQRNAFEVVHNGRLERCYVRDDIRELVISEMNNRSNYDVVYFRSGHYSTYGTPLFKEGNHYFSEN